MRRCCARSLCYVEVTCWRPSNALMPGFTSIAYTHTWCEPERPRQMSRPGHPASLAFRAARTGSPTFRCHTPWGYFIYDHAAHPPPHGHGPLAAR